MNLSPSLAERDGCNPRNYKQWKGAILHTEMKSSNRDCEPRVATWLLREFLWLTLKKCGGGKNFFDRRIIVVNHWTPFPSSPSAVFDSWNGPSCLRQGGENKGLGTILPPFPQNHLPWGVEGERDNFAFSAPVISLVLFNKTLRESPISLVPTRLDENCCQRHACLIRHSLRTRNGRVLFATQNFGHPGIWLNKTWIKQVWLYLICKTNSAVGSDDKSSAWGEWRCPSSQLKTGKKWNGCLINFLIVQTE